MVFEGVRNLITDATAITVGQPIVSSNTNSHAFQAIASGAGAVSATVIVEGTLDIHSGAWVVLETLTLAGTNVASDGFISVGLWRYHRARVTAVGAGSTVNVLMSV